MPPTSLEDLPAELITAILYTVASPTAIRSLIQASARCYKIFLLCKDDILLTTLREFLRPEIKSHLLMVREAYALPPFGGNIWSLAQQHGPERVEAFVNKFSRDHQFGGQVLHSVTPHFVVPQLRTVCTMEYFVEDYCDWVSDHLRSSKRHSPTTELVTGMPSPPRAHQDLSRVERWRLQRAFFRFEIFSTALHCAGAHDRAPSAKLFSQRHNDRFLNILQPWEREEFVCILDYLSAKVEAVFDKLELDYVERMTERFLSGEMDHRMTAVHHSSTLEGETDTNDPVTSIPGAQDPTCPDHETNGGQPEARVDHSVHFFATSTKRNLHARYVAHLITLGLPYLRRLFQSRIKDQREFVFSNLKVEGEMSNLVAQKWTNRDQASLLRRQGVEGAAQPHRHRQLGAAAVIANTAAGAAAVPPAFAGLFVPGHVADVTAGENQRVLTFEGDKIGKPNLGLLWTHGFTGTNVCGGACDHLHRALGYVFWDQGRLNEMGLLRHSHRWEWKELRRRNRKQEKSAQERLADMGFMMPLVEKAVFEGEGRG